MIVDRLPPYDEASEEAVIGSCLIDPAAIIRVMPIIEPRDFYIVKNAWVFEAMLSLYRKSQPIDFQTIIVELGRNNHLDEIGGPARISYLVNSVPVSIHAEGYADIVKKKSIRRAMLQSASKIAQLAYAEDGDEYDQLAQARVSIAEIAIPSAHIETVGSVSGRVYDSAVDAYENPVGPDEVRGISTGLIDFDKLIGGITARRMVVIAGRPGMNKSTLSAQLAFMAAERCKARCAIFSLEMTNDEVMRRQLARVTGIAYQSIEDGKMDSAQWESLTRAHTVLSELPIFMDDNSQATIGYIESAILRYGPFDLIVVDHLGLLHEIQHAKTNEMVHIVGRAARSFKTIAKDYNLCAFVVSQLNRGVESRDDKRPLLSDLRDSGNIEEHADEVYMLYRDDYYNPTSDLHNTLEIIRRKGRSKAQRKTCDLYFDGPTISLKNAVRREIHFDQSIQQ